MNTNASLTFLKMLRDGKAVSDFLCLGEEVLKEPIIFAAQRGQSVTYSRPVSDASLRKGLQCIQNNVDAFFGFGEKISGTVPFLMNVPETTAPILCCPAIWNTRKIGLLILPECTEIMVQTNTDFLIQLADVCALASMLALAPHVPPVKKKLVSLLRDVADGRIEEVTVFENQLKDLGFSRYLNYLVISMYSAEYAKDSYMMAAIQEQLVQRDDIDWILTEADHFLIISAVDKISESLMEFMLMMHEKYGFIYGVSDCSHDLWELPWRIHEAKETIQLAVTVSRMNVIYYFDDFKFYAIANLISDDHWESYLSNGFKDIMEYDRENSTEYLRTIQSYITNNANIQKTSDELFLHKNTLFYRLKRIKDLFGLDLEAHSDLLKIYFSFAVYKLKKNHVKSSTFSAPTGIIKL